MKKTVLSPYDLPNNVSFKIKRGYLNKNGYTVIKLSEAIKTQFADCKIVNLNFYESSYTSKRIKAIYDYVKKSVLLKYMDLIGIKIVFTMHNKIGHDTKFPRLEKLLMKQLCMSSDAIVILCDDSKKVLSQNILNKKQYRYIENKIIKIPLVSYETAYQSSNINLRKKYAIPEDAMLITFVGGIRRYKNVELLIETANILSKNNDLYFLIAGSGDSNYIAMLKNMTKTEAHLIFTNCFVEDSEMADLAHATDVFAFPFDQKSSLNSGSCLYAFSFGRNVICPKIGTINDLEENVTYSYTYNEDEKHFCNLLEACKAAYREWKYNRCSFIEKQKKLLLECRKYHSVEIISAQYDALYKRLENKM